MELPPNDPFAQFFEDGNMALGFVQGAVARALRVSGVELTQKDGMLLYTVKVGERDVLQAQYRLSTKTLTWLAANSTKLQDRFIKAHACVFDG